MYEYLPFHHRALSPQNVTGLHHRYAKHAHECIREAVNMYDGQSPPLFPFVIPSAFYSACYAFFGRAFDAEKSYKPFQKFDNQFHILAAGVPRLMMLGPHRAWSQVGKLFEQYIKGPHEDCSDFVLGTISGARDANWVCNCFLHTLNNGAVLHVTAAIPPSRTQILRDHWLLISGHCKRTLSMLHTGY